MMTVQNVCCIIIMLYTDEMIFVHNTMYLYYTGYIITLITLMLMIEIMYIVVIMRARRGSGREMGSACMWHQGYVYD